METTLLTSLNNHRGQIISIGNPLLRQHATPFTTEELQNSTNTLRALGETMRDTLRSAGGVGLAGPQVALARRVFVVECNGSQILPGPLPFLALFNPRVDTSASSGTERVHVQEGCLSVPGMRALVPRFSDVTVSFFDVFAQRERRIRATGCLSCFTLQCFLLVHVGGWLTDVAAIMQHENDHLDGIFYLDRMLPETLCSTVPDETGTDNCAKYHANEGTKKGTWELLD